MHPDDSINPEYNPIFINPDPEKNSVKCNEFVNYDLDNGSYYGFEGRSPGEKTTIYDVLVNFSDEPDWGMDRNLNLSFAQKFMAGSQGYRHMYYPFWTFHIPYPLIEQGDAPERAEHFFQRALLEYKKGNFYSAYRELARSMHYVMDMAQPFHTKQLYYKFVHFSSPFNGTVQTIKNYHFAYETFVANLLQMEECGKERQLINKIVSAEPLFAASVENLSVLIAVKSNAIARKLMPVVIKVFGDRYNTSLPKFMTKEEFISLINDRGKIKELIDLTSRALSLTSSGEKGLIMMFQRQTKD